MYRKIYARLNAECMNWQTEEEVRLGWLQAIREELRITFHAERGRSDADYNQIIIEFKNVGLFRGRDNSPKFIEALKELERYITTKAAQDHVNRSHYIGIAIDGRSVSFAHFVEGKTEFIHGPVLPLSPYSVGLVIEACRLTHRRALTADNLIEDFGQWSVVGKTLMQVLADSLLQFYLDRGNNKIKMLYEEWKSLYGQVANLSEYQIGVINHSIGFTARIVSDDRLSFILFVIHTYNSIIIKLLAAEIVSQITNLTAYRYFSQTAVSLDQNDFIDLMDRDIEHSELYSRAHIHGFVEEPLFSWYVDAYKHIDRDFVKSNIVDALKGVLLKLSSYMMEDLTVAQTTDVLKRFYQNLVPQELRKSLGEFYTPDWLVDIALDKVSGNFEELRFLDPTCGSASFLISAIRRIRNGTTLSGCELLDKITKNVWGFDLNPLAVQTARVNYLISISDLIEDNPGVDIEIPVLLADAIYSPAPDPDGDSEVVNYVIGSNVANLTITLPTQLALNRERLDSVFRIMGDCVEENFNSEQMLKALVENNAITLTETTRWERFLSATFDRVLSLHQKNWNGIWFRIVRNYFWSATAGKFDVVFGNPPWVRWSKLPELYRDRVRPTCQHYDIFSSTPYYGGNELDISGLITFTVSDKWLSDQGQLVFLLTQTHFQSASSQGFRRFHIDDTHYLNPVSVDDLKALKPFPDAANKTVIFKAIKTHNRPEYPVPYTVWNNQNGMSRVIPETISKQGALSRTQLVEYEATPVSNIDSPWAILPPGEYAQCKKLVGQSDWVEGKKGITCDLNGVYFVNIVGISSDNALVQIETRPEAGRTNIGPKQRFWVEPELLYPLVKGAGDLKRCYYSPEHELCAIIPNRGISSNEYHLAQNTIERQNPQLYRYLRTYRQQLQERSTYRTRMASAPFYSIYNVGEYTFKPWKVMWAEQPGNRVFPVVVVHNRYIHGLGDKLLIPDHKIYFVEFDESTPAYYLCGLLTCTRVQRFIRSFHVMLQVGDLFKHMNLPRYNPSDLRHIQLAELVKEAHLETNDFHREALISQISELGNAIIQSWTP